MSLIRKIISDKGEISRFANNAFGSGWNKRSKAIAHAPSAKGICVAFTAALVRVTMSGGYMDRI